MTRTFCAIHFFMLALCATAVVPSMAQAQTGGRPVNDFPIVSPAHPVWLLEQPFAEDRLLTARTYGESAYGEHRVKAMLEVNCQPQSSAARVSLQIAPAALGFDSAPFEGPDASASGPMRIAIGAHTGVDHLANGFWSDGGSFQVGTVFAIGSSLSRDELAQLVSDALRGQPLRISLSPAKAGDGRLTASFLLPKENGGLKAMAQACLGAATARP